MEEAAEGLRRPMILPPEGKCVDVSVQDPG
jgi:hypothetical protein